MNLMSEVRSSKEVCVVNPEAVTVWSFYHSEKVKKQHIAVCHQ